MAGSKLPTAAAAWATLQALDDQEEQGQQDIERGDYVGPVPTAVLVAVLKHLHQRIKALEDAAARR